MRSFGKLPLDYPAPISFPHTNPCSLYFLKVCFQINSFLLLPILFLIALLCVSSWSIRSFILNTLSPVTAIERINEKPLSLGNLKKCLWTHLITIKYDNMGSSSSIKKKVAPSLGRGGCQRYLMLNFNWATK